MLNEYIIIITADDPNKNVWLKTLIDGEYVTNILKRIPPITDDSFNQENYNFAVVSEKKKLFMFLDLILLFIMF